ncbi:metallophosphoesterase [Archaeoglobus neptunius]|uniref:metallophosphoesterase n=1 Tax=Archaeoglobus neptunius TaxID=2798580 RepID=UPI0019277D48|nr:metallophosphoesterase [Archaeoglobus neptunius]
MYLTELIEEAASNMPKEKMVIIEEDFVTVIGDVHADIEALNIIEKKIKGYAIFLGDYADRGKYPIECYEKILKLFLEERALLLRGNHENTGVYPHELPYQLEERLGEEGREIYELLVKMWQKMPVSALIENKLWLAHGGVPTKKCMIDVDGLRFSEVSKPDEYTMLEIMWNDPWEREECGENHNRGVMYFYGKKATDVLLEELGVRAVIRSHEPKKVLRVEQDGRVITIGSCANPYGIDEFAVLLIDLSRDFGNGWDIARKFGMRFSIYNV